MDARQGGLGPLTTAGRPPTVLAEGLSFRYPSDRIGLGPTSLECAPGEVVALVGPNGAGKSTFLRLLATDLRPTGGHLRLLGRDAARPSPELRRRIAWAPDEPVHLDALTGRENLRFFARLREGAGGDGRSGAPDDPDRRGERLLHAFGLAADADVPAGEYSFGMRRKLLLAEALAPRPELLLLDEPTVGLDPGAVAALRDEVRSIAEGGATVFLATNEIVEAPSWAERILFFHRGRVLEDGSREELLRRVRGRTRITVHVVGEAPPLADLPGAEEVYVRPGRIVVETGRGSGILPDLLARLLAGGASVREVQVREPDLSDVFRVISGAELEP